MSTLLTLILHSKTHKNPQNGMTLILALKHSLGLLPGSPFLGFVCQQNLIAFYYFYSIHGYFKLYSMHPSVGREYIIISNQQSMFFGRILNGGQTYKFSPQQAEQNQGEVLSITNIVLGPSSRDSVSLFAKRDDQEVLVAVLSKQHPHAAVSLFISLLDEVTLIVRGNGAVHISGFFQPDQVEPLPQDGEYAERKETNLAPIRAQSSKVQGKGEEAGEDEDDDQDQDFEVGEGIEEDQDDEEDDDEEDQQDQELQQESKPKIQQNISKPQQTQQNSQNKLQPNHNHNNKPWQHKGNKKKKNKHSNKPFPKN